MNPVTYYIEGVGQFVNNAHYEIMKFGDLQALIFACKKIEYVSNGIIFVMGV